MLAFFSGLVMMIEMSQHDELRPISDSDLELRESLIDLPTGSIVYSENTHWGHLWDVPPHIQLTSIPALGLVELESSIQAEVTTAIKFDDVDSLSELAITHAITSPRGVMQFYLAESEYWNQIENIDSSKMWQLMPNGNQSQSNFIAIGEQHCITSCQQRTDTWASQKFLNPIAVNEKRIFIQEGIDLELGFLNGLSNVESNSTTICILIERIGNVDSAITTLGQGLIESQNTLQQGSGFIEDCFYIENTQLASNLNYSIKWGDSTSSKMWINPTGLSGRGDVIFDHSGLILHWVELID